MNKSEIAENIIKALTRTAVIPGGLDMSKIFEIQNIIENEIPEDSSSLSFEYVESNLFK